MIRLFLLALFLQAAVSASSKLLLEFVDSTGCIDKFQLARVERVASVADIDSQFTATDGASFEFISTTTANGSCFVLGVDAFFHGISLIE